jgi:peroxiredoxin Q/BCP
MTQLQSGDRAPAFTAEDQHGNTVSLADFKGRKCFIFFYPKANTSG